MKQNRYLKEFAVYRNGALLISTTNGTYKEAKESLHKYNLKFHSGHSDAFIHAVSVGDTDYRYDEAMTKEEMFEYKRNEIDKIKQKWI